MSQLKLYKVIIYSKNTHAMNYIARVEVIMLDVDEIAVAVTARKKLGYSPTTRTDVQELTGPFEAGHLITYRLLTDESVSSSNTINTTQNVLDDFDKLFVD